MINLFPNDSETFVRTESAEEILSRISSELDKPYRGIRGENLTGWVRNFEFQLTIQLRRQHLFMPVVNGTIEETSKGAIIFMKYSLFPGTRVLLLFWTFVLPVAGGFTARQYHNYWIIVGAIVFLAFIYAVAWANFRLHVKTTRKIIHRVLD